MTARDLIQVPRLGPLDIEPEDWRMLVRHVKAFSKDFEKVRWNPDAPVGEHIFFLDTLFIVARSNGNHQIFLLPTAWRGDEAIPNFIKSFQSPVAFGIVKAMANINRANAESQKLKALDDTQVKRKYNELVYSLEPDNEDVKLSVVLDKTLGKPIYYVVMNVKFEYEIYKTPIENLYGILQPVEEEPTHVEEVQPSAETKADAFECRDCGLRFKYIEEAKRHTESNSGHKIFRYERKG